MDIDAFAIGFDHRDRARLHALWDDALDADVWSEGALTRGFEDAWAAWNGLPTVAMNGWTGAALAALEFYGVRGKKVLCPSNTFMAAPLAIQSAGGIVAFVDCNREDLCMSFEDFERKAREHEPHAAMLVHIGGHIAFDVERIAAFCRDNGIVLLEDCAHAHGAAWHGRRAGTWGDAGIWSFAATKTISTGEGGALVSGNPDLLEYARAFRNYGKPHYTTPGLNYRMNEFTAALGIVGVERLDEQPCAHRLGVLPDDERGGRGGSRHDAHADQRPARDLEASRLRGRRRKSQRKPMFQSACINRGIIERGGRAGGEGPIGGEAHVPENSARIGWAAPCAQDQQAEG